MELNKSENNRTVYCMVWLFLCGEMYDTVVKYG